jgi:hypothetical protein
MLEMLHQGRSLELVPYFKNEIGQVRSPYGIRLRIMKVLDPEAYAKTLEKHKEASRVSEEKAKKRIRQQVAEEVVELESEDEKPGKKRKSKEPSQDTESEPLLSMEEMIQQFRQGRYMEMIPLFKKEVKGAVSPAGIRLRILNALKANANEEQLHVLKQIQNEMDESHPAHKEIMRNKAQTSKRKDKIIEALAKEPLDPAPSREKMLDLFHKGRYVDLIPYFKDQVRGVKSLPGARLRIMKVLDPEAYNKEMKKHKLKQRERARKRVDG